MNIIIIEKRQKEEYQGRQLMEILFAVIFLSKKTTQYFLVRRFVANFQEMFIISSLECYPLESFFFTTAAALVQSLNFSQSLPQSQSCVFICFLWDCRVSLWELFEKNHPIATWFVIKDLKQKTLCYPQPGSKIQQSPVQDQSFTRNRPFFQT